MRLVSGTARWKRGTGTLQNMQMGDRQRVVAGRRGQHKQQTVEASEIERTLAELGGSLVTGVVVVARHSQSVEHRRRTGGCGVNAGSKQNNRQRKMSGRQQLKR